MHFKGVKYKYTNRFQFKDRLKCIILGTNDHAKMQIEQYHTNFLKFYIALNWQSFDLHTSIEALHILGPRQVKRSTDPTKYSKIVGLCKTYNVILPQCWSCPVAWQKFHFN